MTHGAFRAAYNAASSGEVRSAARTGRRAESKVDYLEARCDRLAMLCEAMWTLLRDQLKLTDVQLLDRINDIDMTDGRLDGKVKRGHAITCHKCDRNVSRKFAKCIYCGALLAHDPFA